jgi:basic amino acid/polyamine antiporter, APA family
MTDPVSLKRSLSLPLLTFYGLGTILGAGIYVLVGKVAVHAGPYVPVAFLVAGLLAACTALSYAELAARYPKSGGAAVYVQAGFQRQWLALFVGFLMILTGMVSAATLVNGFVGYLHVFTDMSAWLVITLLVLGMGALAAWGIAESVATAALITIIELGGLIFILVVTGRHLAELPARFPEFVPPADLHIWNGILLGAFLAFYAFIGFEDMVNVAEETKEPTRNVPLAILLALGIATLLYLLVALAAVLALPADKLARTEAPFALLYTQATGQAPTAISLISLFAVVNGALIQIIMAARVLYGMSREGWLHAALGRVHPVRRTPLLATALVTLSVLMLALWLPLVTLAKATSFITLVAFSLINLALLRIKRRAPPAQGRHVYPAWVPLIGFLTSFGFVLFQIANYVSH